MRLVNGVKKRLVSTCVACACAWMVSSVVFISAAQPAPGTTNTISGKVRIFDQDGNEKTDRSNVVVFIDGVLDHARSSSAEELPQVTHKGRQFAPKVLPLTRGDTVDFFNDDNIFHNVFSLSKPKPFDLGIYAEGTSRLVTFPEPGLVKIYCNIHPKMVSTILVLNNDLYTTTDRDGSFRIDGIPDGTITLRVWSEFSEEQSRTVSLNGSGEVEQEFEIHETKRIVQHKNKFGKRYPDKY